MRFKLDGAADRPYGRSLHGRVSIADRSSVSRRPKKRGGGWQHVRPASGYSWRHPEFGTERQIDHIFLSASLVPRRVEYLWEFERLAPEGTSRKVGRPDHAMLVCEFDQAP